MSAPRQFARAVVTAALWIAAAFVIVVLFLVVARFLAHSGGKG